jgi:hypothetical protein
VVQEFAQVSGVSPAGQTMFFTQVAPQSVYPDAQTQVQLLQSKV